MFGHWELLLAVIGTAASFCSLLLAAPNRWSRLVHFVYTGAIVVVVYLLMSFQNEIERELNYSNTELERTQETIRAINDIKRQAKDLLDTMHLASNDEAKNRGNVIKAIAFLETHKAKFPETFEILKRMTEELGFFEKSKPYFEGGSEMQDSSESAGKAARDIIEAISVGVTS